MSENINDINVGFGWESIFSGYSVYDFLKDSIFPSLISLGLSMAIYCICSSTLIILQTAVDISLSILPSILGLVVAGYVILISFYWSNIASKIKEKKGGLNLLINLNSTFAATVIFLIGSLVFSIVIKMIISLNILCNYADAINGVGLFSLLYFVFFALFALKDVIVNLYNVGQSSLK
uniref:hypothetical protein n=1 Tax=uncultured Dysgonomonas sp. TaxID=206096 RepID=UPI00262A5ADC|nr:hypothetical protein [uncultured Dysgonomonas sp.]